MQGFTYVYDRYGNRWQQVVTAGSGSQFQIGFDKGNNRDCYSCYDAAGNKTYDGIHNYTYDAEGNVTAVDGGQTATYTYDALNRRFRVKNAQNTVDYQFDVLGRRSVVWQENADFGIRDTYWWGGQPFAYHGFNGGTYYEQQDWLGTERLRTDSTGKTVATYFSLPFGDGFSSTGSSDETPDHFAGTERDAETATDHAQFRQYQEGLGRWMSGDPYLGSYNFGNPQSFNRYSYAGNNPLALRDPSGLDSQDCWYQQQSGLDPNCSDEEGQCPPESADGSVENCTVNGGDSGGGVDTGINDGGDGGSSGGGGGGFNKKRPIPSPIAGFFHSVFCSLASPLLNAASASHLTVGAGAGASAGGGFGPGAAIGGGIQAVADPQGNIGLAFNFSAIFPGPVFGAGAIAGAQASVSNARTISDLNGQSLDVNASGAIGPVAAGLDVSRAPGGVYSATATIGVGAGGKGAAILSSYTFVPPALSTNCW